MRRFASLSFFLVIVSVISGSMLSDTTERKIQQYQFLREWWIAALTVFVILIFLYALQSLIQKVTPRIVSVTINILAILVACAGIIFSNIKFKEPSSEWGERFLVGMYLFWIGWIVISVYLLLIKRISRAVNRRVGADM